MKKILFIGSKAIGADMLELAIASLPKAVCGVVTVRDSADDRSALGGIESICHREKLALRILEKGKGLEACIAEFEPDICLVVCWYWILPERILKAVPGGFVGIHNSLLPKFRGGSPLVWSIIAGGMDVGYSIFQFSEGVDDGPIWDQQRIELAREETIADALEKITRKLKTRFPAVLKDMTEGIHRPIPQDLSQSSFCLPRSPSDGLIDWSDSAEKIHDFIRAQSPPYPGAYTYLDGVRVVIDRTIEIDGSGYGYPGAISYPVGGRPAVICGDNRMLVIDMHRADTPCDVRFGKRFDNQGKSES